VLCHALQTFVIEVDSLFLLLLALFLFPIAVYCTVLGIINRRPQPLVVSGAWDFVGVLLATSGFLLFVGPALLSGAFRQSLHELPVQRESPGLGSAIAELWAAWWVLWLLYYLFVLGGAIFLIWTRRNTLVIYNVEPQILDSALARAAQRLDLKMEHRGNQLSFGHKAANGELTEVDGVEPASPFAVHLPPSTVQPVTVDVEPFPLLSNISVHWHDAPSASRADLERELRKALTEVFTLDNAVGAWLLGIASFLFLFIILLTGLFIAIVMARPY
jgi:hypothetical protein